MSFPYINAYQQFFDSSGSPLTSGTIEFRDPTSNALINSYPTADDADAQTNANANPLTLSATGAADAGLFLEDGVAYKVILKDSAGNTVATHDDVRCPIALPYLTTAAETAAGVTPTNLEYPPGNVLRYGTNTTPGTTDMLAAFNAALSVLGQGDEIFIPFGTYKISATLTAPTVVYWGIRGEGREGVSLDISSVGSGNPLISIVKRGVSLTGFQITGDTAAAPTYTVNGIAVGNGTGVSNVVLRNLRIINCAKGLVLNKAQDSANYSNIEFYRNTIDISAEGTQSTSQRFTDVHMLESEQCYDQSIDSANFTWVGCTFSAAPYNAATKPVDIDHNVLSMLFTGCRFETKDTNSVGNTWDSIFADGVDTQFAVSSLNVTGNYFTGAVDNHINLNAYVEGAVLQGNFFFAEPDTADIKLGASTATACLALNNYYAGSRSTQSIIYSLATDANITRFDSDRLILDGATPLFELREDDASANEGNWDITSVAGQLRFRAVNDAISGWTNWLTVDRTATNVTAINFKDPITVSGTAATISSGTGAPSASAAKGSFYMRLDGSTTNDRAYINTDGGTTWTALTTAA